MCCIEASHIDTNTQCALNENSEVQRFECGDAIENRWRNNTRDCHMWKMYQYTSLPSLWEHNLICAVLIFIKERILGKLPILA